MDKLKLTYFDFSGGRAEPARLAMHIGGIPFEDYRFSPGQFDEIRKSLPLGQVPTLHINDVLVTQSDAIIRYIGKLTGLYPTDDFQALLCDEVMSVLEDIVIKLGATLGMTGSELKNAREKLSTEVLPRYLGWLENQLDQHGGSFFADNRLTIADLKSFVVLRWIKSGVLDHISTNLIGETAPKLVGYIERIAETPSITEYYKSLAKA